MFGEWGVGWQANSHAGIAEIRSAEELPWIQVAQSNLHSSVFSIGHVDLFCLAVHENQIHRHGLSAIVPILWELA